MSISQSANYQSFVADFNKIAQHRHRYEVFRDFVTMSAISMHNALFKDERLETEYLHIVGKYTEEEVNLFCVLFAKFISLLDPEPSDILGNLYMSLDLGNGNMGQFFTPSGVCDLMAQVHFASNLQEAIPDYTMLHEPTCGSGGMVLAFVKKMISHGHNPADKLFVQCQDIDRLAALMCYLQLSLWNIPAVVIVGDTLKNEAREIFYTQRYYLGLWRIRLKTPPKPRRGLQPANPAQHAPDDQPAPAIDAKAA
jgi:type I restriction-modification system DNA methylase subunit